MKPPAAGRTGGALVLALLALTGCSVLLAPFRGSSDAPSPYERELRALMREGAWDSALARVEPERSKVGDELLRLQYEGLLAHYAGRPGRSNEALQRASRLVEERYTKSLTRALLSVITSDRVLAYDPPDPERFLLHYYGALNYLRQGDPEEAAVEARLLSSRLRDAMEEEAPEGPSRSLQAALHRLAGAVFEAAGDENDAAVSYRLARKLEGEPPGQGEARPTATRVDGVGPAGGAEAGPGRAGTGGGARAATGEVLVLVERGFAPYRVERSINVLIWPDEMVALRSLAREEDEEEAARRRGAEAGADTARALRTALEVARRALGREGGSGAGAGGWRPPGETRRPPWLEETPRDTWRRRDDRDEAREGRDGGPRLLRVAWPEYRSGDTPWGRATVYVDGTGAGTTSRSADLGGAVVADFRSRAPAILAKTLLRAVAKAALTEAVEEEVSEEDETLGEVVGAALEVGAALLERADTRSWQLLPSRIELARLELPAGMHRLSVGVPGRRGPGEREIGVGEVRVVPGRVAVVSVRTWR